jgi:hypothetical protein
LLLFIIVAIHLSSVVLTGLASVSDCFSLYYVIAATGGGQCVALPSCRGLRSTTEHSSNTKAAGTEVLRRFEAPHRPMIHAEGRIEDTVLMRPTGRGPYAPSPIAPTGAPTGAQRRVDGVGIGKCSHQAERSEPGFVITRFTSGWMWLPLTLPVQ